MNKLSLLAGVAIGAVLTAGVAQLQAQAPAPATTTRPAVFVITEQTFIDEKKYMDEFAGKAVETIKAAGGRFIVRANEVTKLSGDAPNRLVITGWESLDDVKKWQAGEYAKLIPIRDQYAKVRSFAVPTCENRRVQNPARPNVRSELTSKRCGLFPHRALTGRSSQMRRRKPMVSRQRDEPFPMGVQERSGTESSAPPSSPHPYDAHRGRARRQDGDLEHSRCFPHSR